jgi:hypothetical protein
MLLEGVPLVPENYLSYQQEEIQARNAFVRSGLLQTNPAIQAEFAKGGKTIDLPFFGDLTGDSELDSDTVPSSPTTIAGNNQTGIALRRRKSWKSSDLASEISGADPAQAIARSTGRYWVGQMQRSVLSTLKGIFGPGGPIATTHSVGGNTTDISQSLMIDAIGLLGDASDRLTAAIMHSATYRALLKLDLVQPASRISQLDTRLSEESFNMPTYLGRPIFQDDSIPFEPGAGTGGKTVYHTYFFGPGAFAYANINPKHAVETDRDTLVGVDLLVNRVHYMVHPDGMSFVGTPSNAVGPTNGELEVGSNWKRVFEDYRNIRVARMTSLVD